MDSNVTMSLTPRMLRDAFGMFATGVTVITAVRPDGTPVGVTANSFTSVSLDPPLILWCIARQSHSVSAFAVGCAFAVTVLGEHEKHVAMHFAGRAAEKFPKGASAGAHGPAPAIPGTHPCRLDCTVEDVHTAGDHLIIVGRVIAIDRRGGSPLAFHDGRFGKLLPDAGAAPLDIWNSLGVELPYLFNEPFA
jgi:flavin reductase (DIM6/NTAB) family NADH-FMN oxidoreductase RutF